jgi:subtilase family serine protease
VNRPVRTLAVLAGVPATLLAAALTAAVPAAATVVNINTGATTNAVTTAANITGAKTGNVRDACPAAASGHMRCFAELRTDVVGSRGVRAATAPPTGYSPADLRAAYNLPATGGANQTVAIVDAGDDAVAEADLAVYRQTYGLPACTTANGCFRKVNQDGAAAPLPPDGYWGTEISLDLDLVSAACPNCKILLVESADSQDASLAAAENTAAALGATEISNSYGGQEYSIPLSYAAAYSHPGVAITASSGDFGYGIPNFPAVLTSVIAVGGTSLARAANTRGWTESVWNSNGGAAASGCSAWVDKPSWQHDANCSGRMVADVSADADPNTGPAIYSTADGDAGWGVVGGTSAASPFIAGVIGLAGNPSQYPDASYFYSHAGRLNDVVGGNNVMFQDCGGDYQCTALPGYDGPTGLGTPNGLGAF